MASTLALALADTLERGATREAGEVRKERGALLGQLNKGLEGMDKREERAFLRRAYASFTGAEIRDLSEGRGALMERLPDAAARERVRKSVLKLHSDVTQPELSPWQARHMAIARLHGRIRSAARAEPRLDARTLTHAPQKAVRAPRPNRIPGNQPSTSRWSPTVRAAILAPGACRNFGPALPLSLQVDVIRQDLGHGFIEPIKEAVARQGVSDAA